MDAWLVSLLSLLVGFVLAFVPRWFDRKRNLSCYWKVLRQEIEYCHDGALGVSKAGVLSPLGRLPTAIYDEVLKHIVAEGDVEPAEVRILMRYYDNVRQVNDSLNLIAAALESGDSTRAQKEFGRTKLKTAKFEGDHAESYFAPTIELVNRRCSRSWWNF